MPQPPFQALTVKAKGRLGHIVTDVHVTPAFDISQPPDPPPAREPARALWDTGATRSVVSESLVASLGLTPVGSCRVRHADGESTKNTYLVNFFLPNSVCMGSVLATDFPASQHPFDAIIGMDVICFGDFSITNVSGATWMSFRTPSTRAIDYVVEADKILFAGTGRNAPCPCGSGKKFKKCHGG